jgi:hypothetical protein
VLWRVFAAPQTLMVLVGLIALALILGTLVPQIPSQARGDPQAWLAAQSGVFGPLTTLIQALRLYDLVHAFWFRLLLALAALCLLVRAVESGELAWRATAGNRWTPAALALWGGHPPQARVTSPLPPETVQSRLDDVLGAAGYGWADVPEAPVTTRGASRRALLLWAQPLAYGALLAALAGLAILATWGWQSAAWQPVPGESRTVSSTVPGAALGPAQDTPTPLQVRLDGFDLVLEDGQLRDSRSQITWLEGDVVFQQDTVGVGQPSTMRGVALRQMGYLPTIRLRGLDESGEPLVLQTPDQQFGGPDGVEIVFPSAEAQPVVLIPSHDLVLALSFEPLCAGGGPVVRVDLLRSGTIVPEPVGSLYESVSLHFDGLQVDLALVYRPLLRLDYRPGMGLVVGGSLLALIALAATWIAPPAVVWIAIGPGDDATRIRALAPSSARASRWWADLADRMKEALAGGD